MKQKRWLVIAVLALATVLPACGGTTAATATPTRATASSAGSTVTVAITPTPTARVSPTAAAHSLTASATAPVSTASDELQVTGLVQHTGPLTVAAAQQISQESVEVTFQSSKGTEQHRYTGVRLWDVLQRFGLQLDANRKNDQLRKYVVVTGRDGYEVVVGLGEIDPNFGARPILLAWEEDGAPLAGERGPFRLVVPGDVRGGRYVTGVVKIEVRDIDSPPRR
ncbi:MAG: molybdopterin-dependent oxidoreductase [Thermomicrobium sp.]|nr:molybdopterin-dependent oxidoreductase [Thermomicrobium sp.]MDW8007119.1 molybdopterin-dependent oxidoreductase [Thermomicrobium sp.]